MFGLTLPSFLTKQFIYVVLALLGIIGVLGLYIYISHLRNEVEDLTQENSRLSVAISEQQRVIDMLKTSYEQIIKEKEDFNKKVLELQKKNQKLEDELFRERQGKKSLEELVLGGHGKLVEKSINNATKKVFRCLEAATGKKNNEICEDSL